MNESDEETSENVLSNGGSVYATVNPAVRPYSNPKAIPHSAAQKITMGSVNENFNGRSSESRAKALKLKPSEDVDSACKSSRPVASLMARTFLSNS